MADNTIQVVGLKDLQRALKQVDRELPKELRGKMKTIATRVAGIVRGKLPTLSGLMVAKTKAVATQKSAGISWRGVPYAGPTEFGGYPKGREYIATGRYIYPTVDAERSSIEEELERVVDDIIRKAGLSG